MEEITAFRGQGACESDPVAGSWIQDASSESGGDVDKAVVFLREKGLARRNTRQGLVVEASPVRRDVGYLGGVGGGGPRLEYLHTGRPVGLLIDVNREPPASSRGRRNSKGSVRAPRRSGRPECRRPTSTRPGIPRRSLEARSSQELLADLTRAARRSRGDPATQIVEGKAQPRVSQVCL